MSQRNEQWMPLELDRVSHWLIHQAALRAPECLCSRLEEEWLADCESRCSASSRLRFALGCCWATVVIVHDFPPNQVPAAVPVAAARGFISVADRNVGYVSLRSGTLFLIVGLHAAVFCALITTLSYARGAATPAASQNQVLSSVSQDVEIAGFFPAK